MDKYILSLWVEIETEVTRINRRKGGRKEEGNADKRRKRRERGREGIEKTHKEQILLWFLYNYSGQSKYC